jgi:UDP-N-acetylmuramoylalanine-D-glutamate ligase
MYSFIQYTGEFCAFNFSNFILSDKGKLKDSYKNVLSKYEIKWEEEQHTENLILNADEVVKSPGIPEKVPLIKKLIEKKKQHHHNTQTFYHSPYRFYFNHKPKQNGKIRQPR